MTTTFDWKAGLVALGFLVAGIVGAILLKDPAARAACVSIVVAGAAVTPSFALHRSGS
jgi:hypothetical protein